MDTGIFVVLIIILLCFHMMTLKIESRCNNSDIIVDNITGTIITGKKSDDKLGYQIRLDRDLPCGVYSVTTKYNDTGLIFMSNMSPRIGNLYIKSPVSSNIIEFVLVKKINKTNNNIINVYNNGCCK